MLIKNQKLFTLIILIVIVIGNFIFINADESTENLQSIILEDYELKEGKPKRYWAIVPNRFGREGNIETGKSMQELTWVEAWPDAYFGKDGVLDDGNERKEYKNCLAARIAFNRRGYNFVELFPLSEKDGKYIKEPIPFRGRVKLIDMWIWGSNYDYDIDIVLMDYRNVEHRIKVGNINHAGWKNFTINIPNYVPQAVKHIPRLKRLRLVKIVIMTKPEENITGAYVYFDHIKYLSDMFESRYDGYNLEDPEELKTMWEKAPKAPDITETTQSE